MSTPHAPGPWWETESGVRDRGGLICHTISPQRYPGQEDRFERETIERAANKNLIAAAPDLLAALTALRAYLSKCPPHAEDRTGAEWGRMMDLSGAALAKAEGKS
jgi:hypothetical protein